MNTVKPMDQEKYDRARKKVKDIKGFHSHLTAYIIVNIIFLLIRGRVLEIFYSEGATWDLDVWLRWNMWGTAVLWGIGLAIHGIYVYRHKFRFLKRWEERKIREILEKEERDNTHNQYE